jgi:hypothetical protein
MFCAAEPLTGTWRGWVPFADQWSAEHRSAWAGIASVRAEQCSALQTDHYAFGALQELPYLQAIFGLPMNEADVV